tara:strand:+ start:101 stop:529 length:429 start_codon:yes stop_codon:yes gene_type:complete
MSSTDVDLMKMAEGGGSAAPPRSPRSSVADRYEATLQQSGRASNADTDAELAGLRRQSSGAKGKYEAMMKQEAPKPSGSPPRKKTIKSFTPEKKDPGRASFVDPDLKESPRLKDSPFLQKDPDAKVNKPVKPTSRWCKCFSK